MNGLVVPNEVHATLYPGGPLPVLVFHGIIPEQAGSIIGDLEYCARNLDHIAGVLVAAA